MVLLLSKDSKLFRDNCNLFRFCLQQINGDTAAMNGDSVSAPEQVSVESMDNVETVFLLHPHHHRCCLVCFLSRLNVTAHRVDVVSRFLFPLFFAVFNAAYWSIYLNRKQGHASPEQ